MIEIHDLGKSYKSKDMEFVALENINLSIQQGESVSIMGKSGAGKTTLMNILGCLDRFDTGSYNLNHRSIAKLGDAKLAKIRNEDIGFVMQDFALIEHKSVLFNASLPMYFDKTPYRNIKKLALTALDKVGVQDQSKKKVSQLSGGQKQRVAIARAIVKHPKLILADEPTGSVDSETGRGIMETLMEMNREGITVVVVTHDNDIAAYCKRRIVLSDGHIVFDGK